MSYLIYFIVLFVFWLLITFSLTLANIVTGMVVALITTMIFGRYLFRQQPVRLLQPRRYLWFVIYLGVFAWECFKANLDVAYRVLHPALPIRPGIVKVKMRLKTKLARAMLANSITMTPGTITVDIVEDYIYVHWIYISSDNPEEYGEKVSGRFEKYIERIFE